MHTLGVPLAMSAFGSNRVFSFPSNLKFAETHAQVLQDADDDLQRFRSMVVESVTQVAQHERLARVAVDVSSMTRARIAATVESVEAAARSASAIRCGVLYAPAHYRAPVPDAETIIESVDPVSHGFTGWDPRVDAPTVAVFGLG